MSIRDKLRQYVSKETRIDLSEKKLDKLIQDLEEDMPQFDLDEVLDSRSFVPIDLANAIRNHITVNETFFFRHPEHFQFLERELTKQKGEYEIFFGGCSSGQEVYSLAILLSSIDINYNCTAVDLSPQAIEIAKEGSYSSADFERTAKEYKELCIGNFDLEDGINQQVYRVKSNVKRQIRFSSGDVFKAPLLTYDLIFCRNILIYFDEKDRATLVNRLIDHLRDSRLILLGAGELIPEECAQRLKKQIPGVYRKVP